MGRRLAAENLGRLPPDGAVRVQRGVVSVDDRAQVEVGQLDIAVIADQDVVALEVAVQHAHVVEVL